MPFRNLLEALVAQASGARGAVFCDKQGEHIELFISRPQPAGERELTEFDLKICGAQIAATLVALHEAAGGAGPLAELRLLCTHGTLLCRLLPGRYYLVLLLAPGGRTSRAPRLLSDCAQRVSREL